MKVMFCMGGLNKGGAERVVCNLANYLCEKDIEVHIVVTKIDKIAYDVNPKIVITQLDDNSKYKNTISKNYNRIKKLYKFIISTNPDIMLSFLQEPTARMLVLKAISRKIKRIPLIISVRVDPKVAFNTFKRKLSLKLYNLAEGFIFQTKEAQSFFDEKIRFKSVVIANSLNPKFLIRDVCKNRKHKIVTVGRLVEQKNYPFLINSFSEFLKKYPDYILEIYGDGPLKEELESLIKEKKLKNKVFLKGNVDNIEDCIYNAKMFVIVSKYEGMSNALMEAMALGIPCISTKSSGGGATTLIKNNKNGFLIDVDDEKQLQAKMDILVSNDKTSEEISFNSKKDMKKYDPNIINKQWYLYMLRIIEEKRSV